MEIQGQRKWGYMDKVKEINKGAYTALIDSTYQSNLASR